MFLEHQKVFFSYVDIEELVVSVVSCCIFMIQAQPDPWKPRSCPKLGTVIPMGALGTKPSPNWTISDISVAFLVFDSVIFSQFSCY